MPLINTHAIIVSSQRWGEADRILTFFTDRLGKVRAIAQGARKLKSRFSGVLEPLSHIRLTLFERSSSSLARVSHAELIDSFHAIRENLELMGQAARMVSLIKAITAERDPNESMFRTFIGALRALASDVDPTVATLAFQIHVLDHAGFRPQMGTCTACGISLSTDRGWFAPWSGGLVCAACHQTQIGPCLPMSPGSIAFINQTKRLSFPVVTRLRATGQVRREVEEAIDMFVQSIVGAPLPDPVSWAAEPPASRYANPSSRTPPPSHYGIKE